MSNRFLMPTARRWFVLLAAVSFGLVGGGLILGDVARLRPCHLCNLQRLIYMIFGFWALCGVAFPGGRRLWSLLLALTALWGMGVAGYQSWMQYAPQLATECGFGEPTLSEQLINWLGVKWPSMFMVTGFCTQQDWTFLGLSLANWSMLCFLALLLAAILLFRHEDRRRGMFLDA